MKTAALSVDQTKPYFRKENTHKDSLSLQLRVIVVENDQTPIVLIEYKVFSQSFLLLSTTTISICNLNVFIYILEMFSTISGFISITHIIKKFV